MACDDETNLAERAHTPGQPNTQSFICFTLNGIFSVPCDKRRNIQFKIQNISLMNSGPSAAVPLSKQIKCC